MSTPVALNALHLKVATTQDNVPLPVSIKIVPYTCNFCVSNGVVMSTQYIHRICLGILQ